MASGSSVPSSVNFPISESPQRQGNPASPLKAPHLPFRRISLPTVPSLLHRVSVVSVASFDPFPEDVDGSPQSARPVIKAHGGKASQSRPVSVVSPRSKNRRRDSSVKPTDDRQASKRRKVVDEFYETEKAYVDGLELIYSHFLTPIITSLDTAEPILNRSALTSIFSNFIDIWNLHRSFHSALTTLLEPSQNTSTSSLSKPTTDVPLPNLSPLLLAHFPYLSLYTPFVTAFPSTISALNELITPSSTIRPNPQYNQRFATFLSTQEADPRCNKLKMRDWLLTIVQRCPRYLLLLKDLINSTNKEDPEHAQLTAVHTLVSKITLSLNTSLHTHAQTMALLSLQRATPNLPFQLISPGRTLLKRGALLQAERNDNPVEREFLLFSDCMLWLAPAENSLPSWDWSWSGGGSGGGSGSGSGGPAVGVTQSHHNSPVSNSNLAKMERPVMTRSRSKSEAELETLKTGPSAELRTSLQGRDIDASTSRPTTPQRNNKTKSNIHPAPPPPNMSKRYPSADDKWVYKGRVELVDAHIIVGSALEDDRKFEVLSPEGSFVLYAASAFERDQWTTEIRNAKAQLLVSLNITNPNSTLTSSASTNHVRRALQALPYHPSDDRLSTVRVSNSLDVVSTPCTYHGKVKTTKKDKTKRGISSERRRKVEHWVPAIWIPDGKTTSCMRCGRMFGWRRRRHHCRLCGRCVCAGCSGQTFFITDTNTKSEHSSKPARACDACYESVFPLINHSENSDHEASEVINEVNGSDTITSLSRLPSWLSMPALPVQHQPRALMDLDLNSTRDLSLDVENINDVLPNSDDRERRAHLKVKSHQRLRSYHQILEDFQEQARVMKQDQSNPDDKEAVEMVTEAEEDNKFDDDEEEEEEEEGFDEEDQDHIDLWFTPTHSLASSPVSSPRKQRREDTARRSKRFSLPAIALHTTSVTARTADVGTDGAAPLSRESSSGEQLGRSRRFSLVSGGRNSYHPDGSSPTKSGGIDDSGDLAKGLAAARLSELLGRKPSVK